MIEKVRIILQLSIVWIVQMLVLVFVVVHRASELGKGEVEIIVSMGIFMVGISVVQYEWLMKWHHKSCANYEPVPKKVNNAKA